MTNQVMDELMRMLDAISDDEVVCPTSQEVGRGEKVIGNITNPYTRRLVILRNRLTQELSEIERAHQEHKLSHFKQRAHELVDGLGQGKQGKEEEPNDSSGTCDCPGCVYRLNLGTKHDMFQVVIALSSASIIYDLSPEARDQAQQDRELIEFRGDWQVVIIEQPMSPFDALEGLIAGLTGGEFAHRN